MAPSETLNRKLENFIACPRLRLSRLPF
jgi:hypothetical protein